MLEKELAERAENWLPNVTIMELQHALEKGIVRSRDLVLMYMWRIGKYDGQGPKLRSILELNPDALQIAEALDWEREKKGPRSNLHGIPVILKDNLDTLDGMHTSAGSLALAESYAPDDSEVARRLRAAGAILLGKANMTEWANFMSDHMPSGYSSRGGQTLNPYGPGKFDVGGSSAGSGAAVAAAFCSAAVGTETSGSILNPSSLNSIVGIKPTVGLVSRYGIVPIAHSQDTAGPMARTVEDAAILLGVMAGEDRRDPVTGISEGRIPSDYLSGLDIHGLRGKRIGVVRKFVEELDETGLAVMEKAMEDLRQAGAEVIDPVHLPSEDEEWNWDVLNYEFYGDLNRYLSRLDGRTPIRTLEELIAFHDKNPDRMLKYGQKRLLESDQLKGRLTDLDYVSIRAKDLHLSREMGIDAAISSYGLDALVFPGSDGCHIAAKAGYPSVTVPAGYTANGPLGLTFTASAFEEEKLIRLAYAYEQNTLNRKPPEL